jgi:hypothetical protein
MSTKCHTLRTFADSSQPITSVCAVVRLQSSGSCSGVCAGTDAGAHGRVCRVAVGRFARLPLLGLLGDLVFGFLVAASDELLEEAALLGGVVLVRVFEFFQIGDAL